MKLTDKQAIEHLKNAISELNEALGLSVGDAEYGHINDLMLAIQETIDDSEA